MKTFKGHSVRPIKEGNKAETKTETELIEANWSNHTHTHNNGDNGDKAVKVIICN